MAEFNYWPRYGVENYSYSFALEKSFDAVQSTKWMQINWIHSISVSVAYVVLIYLGRKFMESRKSFELDNALFWWNISLAVFSTMGMIRMAPEMFWAVNSNSFIYSICTASYAQGVTGYWTKNFAMSKVFELVDTAFIVLRKKPLIFLHWYHHVTVLIYTWHAYKDHTASGRWFIFMNYTVHSLMYTYYALRALRLRFPKPVAMLITLLQIAQMVIGVSIGVYIYFLKSSDNDCQQTWSNLYFSFTIYFTYFLLFCNFFYHAYLKRNNRYKAQNSIVKVNGAASKKISTKNVLETNNSGILNGYLKENGDISLLPDEKLNGSVLNEVNGKKIVQFSLADQSKNNFKSNNECVGDNENLPHLRRSSRTRSRRVARVD